MLKIKQFAFNPFGVSTLVVYDDTTRDAIVVDPGMITAGERKLLDDFISSGKLRITSVVNTHLHLDHCFGDNYVRDKYGAKVAAHPDDAFLGATMPAQASMFGIRLTDNTPVTIDVPLKDGDTIQVGNHKLEVLHVPGHSPGSIALYSPNGKFVIDGDALFRGSIGRTDLQGGDLNTLLNSIRTKLMTLPDDTTVIPGHDMHTTIGREKNGNPYI